MGPLSGLKVVELAGIGPAPFCGMMLADMGAEVLRVDRVAPADLGLKIDPRFDVLNRGKRSVAVDLKSPQGIEVVLRLVRSSDALIEGFRPGVLERLGLGPDVCLAANPRLVFGRVTGWGQEGPMAKVAGHDVNYLALTGILNAIGRKGERPVPPLNLVGDFGGGGMLLAFGMLAGLLHARQTGQGQVVDAAMIDGALLLMAGILGMRAEGQWSDERGTNSIDTGAPFYDVYETADGKYIAVGAIEARFYDGFVRGIGLDLEGLPAQWDRAGWPALREAFVDAIRGRSRDEWTAHFSGIDACLTPVLTLEEMATHPQLRQRGVMTVHEGVSQPAPAPRFSMTAPQIGGVPPFPGEHSRSALEDWGFCADEIDRLAGNGILASHTGPTS